MFSNRARYVWLVDMEPTQASLAGLGYVEGGIQVAVVPVPTPSASEDMSVPVTIVGVSASTALLAAVPRINEDNSFALCLGLVHQEFLELVEGPGIEFSIESFTTPLLHPYALQILKGKDRVGHLRDLQHPSRSL